MILKIDLWGSFFLFTFSFRLWSFTNYFFSELSSGKENLDTMGAPNFRRILHSPIYGVAQPFKSGIVNVIQKINHPNGKQKGKKLEEKEGSNWPFLFLLFFSSFPLFISFFSCFFFSKLTTKKQRDKNKKQKFTG